MGMRPRALLALVLAAPSLALQLQLRPTPLRLRGGVQPTMSLTLPVCPASGVLALAAKAGCATAFTQLGLVACFRQSSDPVLKQAPGYSAHQLVALALMIYATTFGLAG